MYMFPLCFVRFIHKSCKVRDVALAEIKTMRSGKLKRPQRPQFELWLFEYSTTMRCGNGEMSQVVLTGS